MRISDNMFDTIMLGITDPWVRTLGVSLVRGVTGWLYNGLENGKIDSFEWKQLAATILRVFVQAFGLTAAGIPPEVAFLTDLAVTRADKALEKK